VSEFLMPDPSIGRESYMHRAAKEVVARWLREAAAEAGRDNYAAIGDLVWRVNRDGPVWGIWEEYPFVAANWPIVWDEYDAAFEFAPPRAGWCIDQGMQVACVADIAVQHKGLISSVVEIVHRHPCSVPKLCFYGDCGIQVFEVSAKWVLEQTKRPQKLLDIVDMSPRQARRYRR
jgi:hypothetical protein